MIPTKVARALEVRPLIEATLAGANAWQEDHGKTAPLSLPWDDVVDRLVAQVAQESQGDPEAVSPAGALGILQVMPKTALGVLEDWGVAASAWRPFDLECGLAVGIRYLEVECAKRFEVRAQDLEDLWRLSLAAYNTGPGRVSDAMIEVRRDEWGRGYQAWLEAGKPAGRWRTFEGIAEAIRADLVRVGYRWPDEPVDYVRAIERHWRSVKRAEE